MSLFSRIEDGARRTLIGRRAPNGSREPLCFLFTIDTEISMGGAGRDPSLKPVGAKKRIWGETEDGRFGIERFMDVFDEHGMKGVFFFEPVARRIVPEADLEEAARAIVGRGHSIELHIHPEFDVDLARLQRHEVKTPSWRIADHPLEAQRAYIRDSLTCIEKWTGRRPIAFRAGGYGAGVATLDALRQEGITVDSSYNAWAVAEKLCDLDRLGSINDVAVLKEGMLEVPVTNLRTRGVRPGLRPFELSSLNATEMISALERLYEAGARTACGVTHSFRLIRARDVQYKDVALDRFNLHRLRALCRHLADNSDRFRVCTFRDLPIERWKSELPLPRGEPFFPTPPAWSSTLRLAIQAVKDRGAV
jgi:peptidoglycan/xylan/chitin deacetylase (PgdA/CDA1 family)